MLERGKNVFPKEYHRQALLAVLFVSKQSEHYFVISDIVKIVEEKACEFDHFLLHEIKKNISFGQVQI